LLNFGDIRKSEIFISFSMGEFLTYSNRVGKILPLERKWKGPFYDIYKVREGVQ